MLMGIVEHWYTFSVLLFTFLGNNGNICKQKLNHTMYITSSISISILKSLSTSKYVSYENYINLKIFNIFLLVNWL